MNISKKNLKEFQKISKKDYGRELNKKDAFEVSSNLLGFFDLLLKIDRRINPKRHISKGKKIS